MSARYRTPVSIDLIEAGALERLPRGMRVVEIEPETAAHLWPYRTVVFDDDDAPDNLRGRSITPVFRQNANGTVSIIGREIGSAGTG